MIKFIYNFFKTIIYCFLFLIFFPLSILFLKSVQNFIKTSFAKYKTHKYATIRRELRKQKHKEYASSKLTSELISSNETREQKLNEFKKSLNNI